VRGLPDRNAPGESFLLDEPRLASYRPRVALRTHLTIALLLTTACSRAPQAASETPRAEESTAGTAQPTTNLNSVIAVVPVKDHAAATAWYGSWIGRDADVIPMDGVAEWNLAANGWLQVALDPNHAGSSTVVIGVNDIDAQRTACAGAGVVVGDVQDHGFIKLLEAQDPDGNKVVFVQETGAPSQP
jgi:predicted enzyme related to lactoylglutathione lyase